MRDVNLSDEPDADARTPPHADEPAAGRGIAKFIGANLVVWAIVVLLAIVFVAAILIFAL